MTTPMGGSMPASRWYQEAVIYQLHVKSFYDANNDGVGDFAGLIEKLDYIVDLGVNTIWLLPFYPSPLRDDGYDISDYLAVHPDYGDLEVVRQFICEAHRRGLRVIGELVLNHTSDQHPWFQRARRAPPGSAHRNYYVWSDNDQGYADTRIIFVDIEGSNWTWDPIAGQYYWHRFYSHQPDLNFDNPLVVEEMLAVMRFWFDQGLDGMRLDALPYLVEREGTSNENLPETHQVLKALRAELDRYYPDKMLLAEANQWPEDTLPYFGGNERGEGDECHMAFHFPLMPRMYMALAQEDRFPISDILRQTPPLPRYCQWALFLRNHDELTLEMVTDEERDYLWRYYAEDPRSRLNVGIRRRLAPLLERDRRRIELLSSLLLSLPGTPSLYYGDELGMGDNIYLGDRDGVRTPMQWSVDRNGGFSRADPASLVLPTIQNPQYGYQAVNVEAQAGDPHSLLNWTRRMLRVRQQHAAVFGRGAISMLSPSNRRVLAYLRHSPDDASVPESILCIANMSRTAQAATLNLNQFVGKVPVEMVGGSAFPPVADEAYLFTLPPYACYWLLLADESQMPDWFEQPPEPVPELRTLVIKQHLGELFQGSNQATLESECLPHYLAQRRWFRGGGQPVTRVAETISLNDTAGAPLISILEVAGHGRYQLPLAFLSEPHVQSLASRLVVSRLRRGREVGILTDGFSCEDFVHEVLRNIHCNRDISTPQALLTFRHCDASSLSALTGNEALRYLSVEHCNSAVQIGESLLLKIYRALHTGIHPEWEMMIHLYERGFRHLPPLLARVTHVDAQQQETTLMVLQAYLDNQGDAWEWARFLLDKAAREQAAVSAPYRSALVDQNFAEFEAFARQLGTRLAEMHNVLVNSTESGDFTPRTLSVEDGEAEAERIAQLVECALDSVPAAAGSSSSLAPSLSRQIDRQRSQVIGALARQMAGGVCCRIHGDLHLGQVLVAQGDAYFVDFEGNYDHSFALRRRHFSPYRDVAGILCSLERLQALAENAELAEYSQVLRQEVSDSYCLQFRRVFLRAYEQTLSLEPQWHDASGSRAALALYELEWTCQHWGEEMVDSPCGVADMQRRLLSRLQQGGELAGVVL